MKDTLLKNTVKTCCVIFCVLIAVHAFEAIVLRMDETVFGENFINKLFGILVIGITLRLLQWKWSSIGFSDPALLRNIAAGTVFAAAVFTVAYSVEIFVLKNQGASVRFASMRQDFH